jgi:hypothetical protein
LSFASKRQDLTLSALSAHSGLAQDVGVVELQAIEIELDRAPGVRVQQLGEVVGQLLLGEIIDSLIEVRADAADGARVGVDGLGLQAFELEVLEVGLIVLFERAGGQGFQLAETSRLTIHRPHGRGDEAAL